MKLQKITFTLLLLFCTTQIFAQDSINMPINPESFNYQLLEKQIIATLNAQREKSNLKVLEEKLFLTKTAYDQAKYMAETGLMDQDDPGSRAVLYGGTRNVTEIVGRSNIKTGVDFFSYKQLAEYAVNSFMQNSKHNKVINNTIFSFIGVSVVMDAAMKKVYYALDFGNVSSVAPQMDASWQKYIGAKTHGIFYADPKVCSRCKRFQNINGLVDEILVENGTIYFIYSDFKKLSKLLKDPYDGIALDIVQKEQFPCNEPNKINYMMPYKGLLQKPIYWPEIVKRNEIKDPKANQVKINLGKMPEEVTGDFEINITVLIDKFACRNLYRNYIEKPNKHTYSYNMMLLKDPKHTKSEPVNSSDITAEYKKQMCYRSSNPSFKNKENFFNCTFCNLRMPEIFTSSDVSSVSAAIDNMKMEGKIDSTKLRLMEYELIVRILSEVKAPDDKANAINRLTKINTEGLDINLVYTLFYLLIEQDEYDMAMNLFSNYYMEKGINEDMLFSFISYSSLSPERLLSNDFMEAIKIANTVNHNRLCQLVSDEKLSFQVFENTDVKNFFCTTCNK